MARRVFHSFHYANDSWRVSQIKNMGVVEGQPLLSANEWEEVKRGGDAAIERWISDQMRGKSCVVVLIGSATAGRKWVKYEIQEGWNAGKGVVGVYIHNLKDAAGHKSTKGRNPFEDLTLNGSKLSTVAKTYNPPHQASDSVYDHIKANIEGWVEEAIQIRKKY